MAMLQRERITAGHDCATQFRLEYGASNATRDDKERANLGLVFPMADDKACPTLGLASRPGFSTLPPAEVDLAT